MKKEKRIYGTRTLKMKKHDLRHFGVLEVENSGWLEGRE